MKSEFDMGTILKLQHLMKTGEPLGEQQPPQENVPSDVRRHVFPEVGVVDDALVGERRRLTRTIRRAYFRAIWGN